MSEILALSLLQSVNHDNKTNNVWKMTKEVSNEELLLACKAGQSEAFSFLVQRIKSPLFNLIYRFLGEIQDTEDVIQDTFVKVYLNLDKYDQSYKATTWIYTIAMNLARTHYRRKNRWLILTSVLKRDDNSPDFIDNIPDVSLSPEFFSELSVQQDVIEAILQKITPIYREVMILRDMEGLAYDEIATILNMNIGTVKSRINRAREEFKKHLAKELRK